MIYVAVWTGLPVSELIGLRWEDVHADSLTIDERCCRGDWGAPKSDASNATIGLKPFVIERIHRLKLLTVEVRAGCAVRRHRVVKQRVRETSYCSAMSLPQVLENRKSLLLNVNFILGTLY